MAEKQTEENKNEEELSFYEKLTSTQKCAILMMLLGSISVYSVLIGVGQLIYGNIMTGLFVFLISIISSFGLIRIWK